MLRHGLLVSVAACLLLVAPPARADDLTLTTDRGSWDDAVAELRADFASEGRTVRVAVRSGGERVACERYLLQLDEGAGRAFQATACDPATQETSLTLAHRAALFDESHDVPRPRTVAITAILRATAVAEGGPQGGSLVRCTVAVQPYLDDALHGTRVLLTPAHYALRPGSASIVVTPEPGGWSLSTAERTTFRIRYDVVERSTGEVVLSQDTTLSCGPDATPGVGVSLAAIYEPPPAPTYSRSYPTPLAAEVPGHFNKAAGVISLAFMGSMAAFLSSAGLAADGTGRSVLYATGTLSGVGAVTAGAVFLGSVVAVHRQTKAAAQPSVSLSNRGATLGASWTF